MGRWVKVASLEEIKPGQGRTVVADRLRVALFNDGGEFFAIDDSCPHEGASLGAGTLHQGRVICPSHSWIFDVRSGQCPRGTHAGVAAYRTRCTDGAVEVEIP